MEVLSVGCVRWAPVLAVLVLMSDLKPVPFVSAGGAVHLCQSTNKLREMRRKLGLTQDQAAARAGIAQYHLSAMETMKVPMRVLRWIRIAKVYGVPLEYLVGDGGLPES
ncbi:MAG: helix-turn-helix transcriptional regulator [Candidatus Velthaea sp.]